MSIFAQLLFTWTIPHLDDFGRITGDPKVLKAMVMPMHDDKSIADLEKAINEMIDQGLIERYVANDIPVIWYKNFENHQSGLKKRTKSKFPDNPTIPGNSEKFQELHGKAEPSEAKETEPKKEPNLKKPNRTYIANSSKESLEAIDPTTFVPNSEGEAAAHDAWGKLEPQNPRSFQTTYLHAHRRGLPPTYFYQFVSDIKQSNCEKPGAVFNKKVADYFNGNSSTK